MPEWNSIIEYMQTLLSSQSLSFSLPYVWICKEHSASRFLFSLSEGLLFASLFKDQYSNSFISWQGILELTRKMSPGDNRMHNIAFYFC